ncbi:hypothetical protein [Rhodopirellula baltica]|uniref:Uncharacterized protein n=2 Tax=Rhodopirellula baltica TaxID=265606 RepID=L7CF60_RHOBT|nr:hypothetical protein [Rhodopirellula baltica]ELP32653.1 hypothetical protein RBSWK_03408 [Rhodopirellula baltica SWK14]
MTTITLGEAAPIGRGVAMNKVVIANAIEIVQRRVSRRLEWIQGMVRCGLRWVGMDRQDGGGANSLAGWPNEVVLWYGCDDRADL